MNALTLNIPSAVKLTDEQFYQLCLANRDLRLERTAQGELIVMPPTGGGTGKRNIKISSRLEVWSSQNNLGVAFDSSTGFKLPNGATRSPDAAWVTQERWDALTPDQQEEFPPICPDFVVELRSASDSLTKAREKMQEYLNNGCRLGWLIDPQNQRVEIYRLNQEVEIVRSPTTLSGEDVLPGFVLDLTGILSS
ncbi:MAG TPA: Uma2 family endonuclease [Candidatus Obscuribacterales bacterium]